MEWPNARDPDDQSRSRRSKSSGLVGAPYLDRSPLAKNLQGGPRTIALDRDLYAWVPNEMIGECFGVVQVFA